MELLIEFINFFFVWGRLSGADHQVHYFCMVFSEFTDAFVLHGVEFTFNFPAVLLQFFIKFFILQFFSVSVADVVGVMDFSGFAAFVR